MKTNRQLSKEQTREKILTKTKEMIVQKGALNTSTKQIADHCGVAHGTIFAHFETRGALISELFKRELIRIAGQLYEFKAPHQDFTNVLHKYFDILAAEEDLLVVIAKEFPFLSHQIRQEIITTESIVRILFYGKIEEGIEEGIFKNVDITSSLSFLFGTINYYLSRRELFSPHNEVIKLKKDQIINSFMTYLKN